LLNNKLIFTTDDVKYDLIEKYLAGEMSETERGDFENQLNSDSSLREELNLHRQVSETLKGEKVHQLRDVLKDVDKKWQAPSEEKEAKVIGFPFRKMLSIAAAILVLVVAYFVISPNLNNAQENLFASNFEPYKMVLNQRSLVPNPETEWMRPAVNKAISAYNAKDYAEASKLFQNLSTKTPDANAFQIYAAISELSLGHSDKAIAILEKLVEIAPPLFIEQSRWYLSLAYLQKEDYAAAKSQLQQIKSGAFKYAEAQKMLKSLQ